MNCEQFREILPHVIDEEDAGGNAEVETHAESCPSCGEMVRDLRHIAEQAPLLLPMHDPGPRVWSNIQQSLISEGLIRGDRTPRPASVTVIPQRPEAWTTVGSIMASAAVLILAAVLFYYRPRPAVTLSASVTPTADEQLISQVSRKDPQVGKAYEESLKQVNSYIADAEKAVKNDGNDSVANEQLMDAYQQKAMLYEMATARSQE
ncbi:MAG: zf-HC2 domain-containing protein [Acidobacteriia bacterium]|nr:zf-HC2 domain-containing protein [Terriglobia bacterium]